MTKLLRHNFSSHEPETSGLIAAVGSFDGIHLGHLKLINEINKIKLRRVGFKSALVSFYPHPLTVLKPGIKFCKITSLRAKLRILNEQGIDYLILLHFNKAFSQLSGAEFIRNIIVERLKIKHLVLGEDAAFGRGRDLSGEKLSRLLSSLRCELKIVNHEEGHISPDNSSSKIGSRSIRELITRGEIDSASKLLGRSWTIEGQVIKGDQVGRKLGFPTANLRLNQQLLPKNGVYAAKAYLSPNWRDHNLNQLPSLNAVVNIGVRPTVVKSADIRVEVHILDYELISQTPDFYGYWLSLELKHFIRPELRFDGINALQQQIKIDVSKANQLLLNPDSI